MSKETAAPLRRTQRSTDTAKKQAPKTKPEAKTEAPVVDEAKIAEINASSLSAPEAKTEAPVVDLLGDPVAEAPTAVPVIEERLAELTARFYSIEGVVAALEARVSELSAEKARPALTHARTLDELPSPFAPG